MADWKELLGGALVGIGQGILDEANAAREAALERLRFSQQMAIIQMQQEFQAGENQKNRDFQADKLTGKYRSPGPKADPVVKKMVGDEVWRKVYMDKVLQRDHLGQNVNTPGEAARAADEATEIYRKHLNPDAPSDIPPVVGPTPSTLTPPAEGTPPPLKGDAVLEPAAAERPGGGMSYMLMDGGNGTDSAVENAAPTGQTFDSLEACRAGAAKAAARARAQGNVDAHFFCQPMREERSA